MSGSEIRVASGVAPADRPQARRAQVTIRESVHLHDDHHRLVLEAPEIAAVTAPGQFIHVWVHSPDEIDRPPCAAILRRPYSISGLPQPGGVEILLRVRGVGGRILASKQAGDRLDVIGPLGNGFRIGEKTKLAVVVAGGVGLAATPLLIERFRSQGTPVWLLAGALNDGKVPFSVVRPRVGRATIPEMEALGAEVTFVSETVEGILITEVMEARLGELPDVGVEMFGIGPRAMLKRLAEVVGVHFSLQVSLEERMACGVGACRSCVIPVRLEGDVVYRTVCRDGPVFYATDIAWEQLYI